jgi:hypothetical protein
MAFSRQYMAGQVASNPLSPAPNAFASSTDPVALFTKSIKRELKDFPVIKSLNQWDSIKFAVLGFGYKVLGNRNKALRLRKLELSTAMLGRRNFMRGIGKTKIKKTVPTLPPLGRTRIVLDYCIGNTK